MYYAQMADAVALPTPAEPLAAPPAPRPWTLAHRLLFRFVFSYLVLYNARALAFPPGGPWLARPYFNLWHAINPWVAIHIFGLSGQRTTYFVTGSGDTTLAYIENLLYLVLAIVATIGWSILDRRRAEYRTLHTWLRILVRYTLAFTMFGYGFAKVIPLQFRSPNFARLVERYGDFSPMGVLWQFMGASIPYIIFSGAMEVVGGALLLFRRTTLLGAMILCAVLSNVVALNFCYDVPVKLYSSNLLLMAVFLVVPDLGRVLNLLVRNRAVEPADLTLPSFQRRWLRLAGLVFQLVCIGNVLYNNSSRDWRMYQQTFISPPRQPLHGLYEVESFSRNGAELPPLTTDKTRWSKLIVDGPAGWSVRLMDESPLALATTYDDAAHTVTLTKAGSVSYSQPDPNHLLLHGTLNDAAIDIRLRRIDPSQFLLKNRGFHWISEFPFNR